MVYTVDGYHQIGIMAHRAQFNFFAKVKQQFPEYFTNTSVVEMGSLNINGTVRVLFENPKNYVGIDLGEGSGVDVVCRGEEYDAPDESFDVAISAECFEHNPQWAETFENMYRLTRKGGLITFTCASTGRPEHGTSRTSKADSPFTNDYYRNLTEENFRPLVDKLGFNSVYFEYYTGTKDLYFWGTK
jgi:SAM-dependent methyltransferase